MKIWESQYKKEGKKPNTGITCSIPTWERMENGLRYWDFMKVEKGF